MKNIISLIQENPTFTVFIVALFGACVEFAPIKINPLSWLYKTFKDKVTEDIQRDNEFIHNENKNIYKRLDEVVYIKSKHWEYFANGRKQMNDTVKGLETMNTKLIDAIDNINSKLDEMYQCQDENEMVRLRWEILSFADGVRSGNKHSKDAFHHIIESNDKYHRIIDKRGFTNGVIDAEMEYIMETYRTLRDNDDFA